MCILLSFIRIFDTLCVGLPRGVVPPAMVAVVHKSGGGLGLAAALTRRITTRRSVSQQTIFTVDSTLTPWGGSAQQQAASQPPAFFQPQGPLIRTP